MRSQILAAFALLAVCVITSGVCFYHAIFTHPLYGLPGCMGLIGTIMSVSALWTLGGSVRKEARHAAPVR